MLAGKRKLPVAYCSSPVSLPGVLACSQLLGREKNCCGRDVRHEAILHPRKGNGFPSPQPLPPISDYVCLFFPHSPCLISGPSVFSLGSSEPILSVYSTGGFQEQERLCLSVQHQDR